MTKDTTMSASNMDKWVSGEVGSFFAPNEVPPPPVTSDSNQNKEISRAQFKLRADQPSVSMVSWGHNPTMVLGAAIASIASIAAAALVCLIIWPRPSAVPAPVASPAPAEKSAVPVDPPAAKPLPDRLPSNAELDRTYRDMSFWLDHVTTVTLVPERQPSSPPRWAPRRHHWSSMRTRADHGEAARLMRAELRQMGITPARRHR
jgi:hypothetical protein